MEIQVKNVIPLLQIFDMPASLRFYRDVLGFEVVQSAGGDWAMLRLGGALIMLNTRYEADDRPEAPDSAAVAVHGDTILYFDCPNVDETYAYLRSVGIDVEAPRVARYGMKQLHVEDPDGFPLCFQHAVDE
jgi:catechol 2,3-dioxygenase-like lactoylglutathione lyase family enzyme